MMLRRRQMPLTGKTKVGQVPNANFMLTSRLTLSQVPGLEENASQNQDPDKPDLDKSIRAVIYANTADYSSTRPESIASARPQNAIRERQSYELQPDSVPVSVPELARAGTFASIQRRHTDVRSDSPGIHKAPDVQSLEYDIPPRANTFGTEADGK